MKRSRVFLIVGLLLLCACAPNGETEWNGFPIEGIDTLYDLPPYE